MQRVFAVLFVVTGVVAAFMFGGVVARAQDATSAGPADLVTPTPMPPLAQTPATQLGERLAVVGPDAADLWNRGGTEKQVTLPPGTLLTAVGRSADGQWLYVHQVDGSEPAAGAIQGSAVIVVDAASLPVLAADAAPEILPASTAQADPQTVPTPGSAETTAGITTEITGSAPLTAEVNAGSVQLNVRSGPGTGYPVIAKVATGTVLPVLGRNDAGDWIEVTTTNAGGTTGWVSSAYVGLGQPASALPVTLPTNLPIFGNIPAPSQAPTGTLPINS
ncbi:MAG: SH3 domain-containing protein [Caldilineaceae bacterium]